MKPVSIYPITGLPEIGRDAPLARLMLEAVTDIGLRLEDGDVVIVTQKIVSKAEGQVVALAGIRPSSRATEIASRIGFDARHVEVHQELGALAVGVHGHAVEPAYVAVPQVLGQPVEVTERIETHQHEGYLLDELLRSCPTSYPCR